MNKTESITRRTNNLERLDGLDLRYLLETARIDIANLRQDIAVQAAAMDVLAAKLNVDTGVTDADYATNNVAAVTSATPLFNK